MESVVGRITIPTVNIHPEGVLIHVAQYQPTKRPIEDRFSLHFDADQNRLIVGVYDGHGGPDTADHLSHVLPPCLLQNSLSSRTHVRQFEELDKAMLRQFKRDHSFFRQKSAKWIHNAQVIKSGSTALILDIDLGTLSAAYANAGDCRWLYRGPSLLLQTEDLNMKTSSERDRLVLEHPNEDQMIIGNRLFGRLMSTRGFGDGYYKLPKGNFGNREHRKYIDTLSSIEREGNIPMNSRYASLFFAYKTPPYVTPVPETGSHQLKNSNIVILATDGLWDLVSSEEAMDIVLRGLAADGAEDLASYLLDIVRTMKSPGDDVTIVVLQV
ncbi:phosphatase 2C-like domain-containing protein [Flammula alnicola]|nr:phosphatase 2C-like domain-containing protein [Flammula alnicola]